MIQYTLFLIYLFFICSADNLLEPKQTLPSGVKENDILPQKIIDYTATLSVEHVLENIERRSSEAKTSETEEQVEDRYNEVAKKIEDCIKLLRTKQNTDTFNIKGIYRVITNLIAVDNEILKNQLLVLIKTLFSIAPATTTEVISTTLIDRLLDIFENDKNLALKAHTIDIMSVWLPNNPAMQTRVMKSKGLKPFYDQISKLDADVVFTLLDLFNKILEEHVIARGSKIKAIIKLYENIGLIERMSTPTVCNGILNIFKVILPIKDQKQLPIIVDLIKNIKPFCVNLYKGNNQASIVFVELKRYLTDPGETDLLSNLRLNLTEAKINLEDYIKRISSNLKDEF